jgi:hypothetical protein
MLLIDKAFLLANATIIALARTFTVSENAQLITILIVANEGM